MPHLVVVLLLGLAAWILTLVAWLVIIATGRYPRAFFGFVSGTLRYSTRVGCYWLLVTDRFPPFGPAEGPDGYPVSVWVDEPVRRSRQTAALRPVLAVPALLILYFLALLGAVMSFVAWWAILATGRLPYGMFEVMGLGHRYQARVAGLLLAAHRRVPLVPGGKRLRAPSVGYRGGDGSRPGMSLAARVEGGRCLYSCDFAPASARP